MKRTPLRKQSNKARAILYRKAWAVFSKYIRQRDKGRCVTCGAINDWKNCNAGHFKHGVLDFDEMNINCQCVACNKWNHGRLDRYSDFLRAKYGDTAYEDLKIRASMAKKGNKLSMEELENIIEVYSHHLSGLEK